MEAHWEPMGSLWWFHKLNLLLWLLPSLYSIWNKRKNPTYSLLSVPIMTRCMNLFFNPQWGLRHREGNMSVCACSGLWVRVTAWVCVCWMGRVKRLLNTTSPELQIIHNYLEDQGFYFKVLISFVTQRCEIRPCLESILKRDSLFLNLHWLLVLILMMNGVGGQSDLIWSPLELGVCCQCVLVATTNWLHPA